jgi:uncharacterized surface protein with fasciclin (FAS1) repeats
MRPAVRAMSGLVVLAGLLAAAGCGSLGLRFPTPQPSAAPVSASALPPNRVRPTAIAEEAPSPLPRLRTVRGQVETIGTGIYRNRDILTNLRNATQHQLLWGGIEITGLEPTVGSPGPLTVLAPTDEAFNLLPAGTRAQILAPANVAVLRKVLSYHVVLGRLETSELRRRIAEGGGSANIPSAFGGVLRATLEGDDVLIWDEHDRMARLVAPDIAQTNGVLHVVDTVLLPK